MCVGGEGGLRNTTNLAHRRLRQLDNGNAMKRSRQLCVQNDVHKEKYHAAAEDPSGTRPLNLPPPRMTNNIVDTYIQHFKIYHVPSLSFRAFIGATHKQSASRVLLKALRDLDLPIEGRGVKVVLLSHSIAL